MRIKKILVANRGEIAIRVFRASVELGIKTVAVFTYEDRYSQHRYKADESYQIGPNDSPIKPYLDADIIVKLAKEKGVDAIHPGYGFMSENEDFVQKCIDNDIIFIGPKPSVMRYLGDKVSAKRVAQKCGVSVIQSNERDLTDIDVAIQEAERISYPIMLKSVFGGGGRGMRVIRNRQELIKSYPEAKREALNSFGNDSVFMEKYVENPKHIEVQVVSDNYGNIVHLYERDCSVQRRYQKVIEMAPSYGLDEQVKQDLYKSAVDICKEVNYNNVGTVEFLLDSDNRIYFIEVNPRIQVEHTITEMVTNIDLVKTQIFVAGDYKLDSKEINIPSQECVKVNGYAIQSRITTEDPKNNFTPDYGTITAYRSAAGFGIRLDVGSVYQGVTISPFFDSMLVKVSAHSRELTSACKKMDRALQEFRIRGVKTNIPFLLNIVRNETFKSGKATVNFIENSKELFDIKKRRDRVSKIINYIGEVVVNGNPDVRFVQNDKRFVVPVVPKSDHYKAYPKGTKDMLTHMGTDGFSKWLKEEKKIHYTDTTMRDAHQSLIATRMRTYDMLKVAEGYAKAHSDIFSLEMWGGATFDVCMRFLYEDPWDRLRQLRKAIPNILFQMLLRGSNAVGYSAYSDNLICKFIERASVNGIDIFRVFDSLNWIDNIVPSIDFIRKNTSNIIEAAICYTGDILDPRNTKYNLAYYLQMAKDLENSGAHIIAIKDMAGLLKPYAAFELISALKQSVNLPIHLHTHDTSSLQSATYLKAIEADVDVIDVALGGMSGLTSQPNFNSIVEMMKNHPRENKMDVDSLNAYSNYWERVREYYYPFESNMKSGTAEVYKHEIPGGQYSNLMSQSASIGLGDKFEKIKKTYAHVNKLFGDVIKVTPSSKVVGDMAQFLVSNDYTVEDVISKGDSISYPDSVKSFFMGDLGQPLGGFPKELQDIILKGETPYTERPNSRIEPVDIDSDFECFSEIYQRDYHRELTLEDYLSYKLYPKVYADMHDKYLIYGDISKLPTENFFFGMKQGDEVMFDIDKGKSVLIKLLSVGQPNESGIRIVFFRVNGQTRNIFCRDRSLNVQENKNRKVESNNTKHLGAPLQGLLSKVFVKEGDSVIKGDTLFIIESMKTETAIVAERDAIVSDVIISDGNLVDVNDLVVVFK
ncbi:pyruvate carboxylase [Ichthyobacterium seriolicida]|uniref:Pyruvate carboxylase n=1 Tax=Ichthyobacterium seriolicida TaxID=242600 RepID=A0A1J1DZG4_9FLAO|nr:pyruvate carboxylase [Ichthyobacterium seriolicida]BAV95281.1 pyruvate carboxyl transferase [Ichthyobacterium seriolicida]